MIVLEQAIQFTKEQAKKIVESGEEHQPILVALTRDIAIPIPVSSLMQNKDMFKPVVGELLRQLDAYTYIFINEAWVAKLDKDSPLVPKLFRGEISVSGLPLDDKTEILTIMVAENRKTYHIWFAEIKYTPDNKRYLGEWEEMPGSPEGRLILKEW